MQDKLSTAPEQNENVLIRVNNQVSNEKNLSISNEVNTLIFQSLIILFSSALLTQTLSIMPLSYNLRDFIPTVIFVNFGIITALLYLSKKQPTLKFYLFIISFLIGAILGV